MYRSVWPGCTTVSASSLAWLVPQGSTRPCLPTLFFLAHCSRFTVPVNRYLLYHCCREYCSMSLFTHSLTHWYKCLPAFKCRSILKLSLYLDLSKGCFSSLKLHIPYKNCMLNFTVQNSGTELEVSFEILV